MLILSLDSAGHGCAACVWQDGEILALREERMERGQDARLMPLVLETMAQAGTDFAQLDRIAVTRGPGSFTGLRIGLAAARGMGLAAEKPVVGVDRFRIYRQAAAGPLFVLLDSKRQELFCQFCPAEGGAHEPVMMTPDEITAFLCAHPEAKLTGDEAGRLALGGGWEMLALPQPEVVLAASLAAQAALDDPAFQPRPLYLRAPDVTVRKAG